MKILRLCAVLFCALPLCAVNLLRYDIYPSEQNESVNITLSFDGAYNGKVDEKRDKELVLLTLNGVSYAKEESKTINSPLITGILITPNARENKVIIGLRASNDTRINTKAINDSTGLMIRALDKNAPTSSGGLFYKQEPQQNSFEGKFDYTSYILIMVLLCVLLGALWWLSRSAKRGRNTKEFRVLFQRPLDRQNKFVVLEFGSKNFVMILGTSNVLLEIIDKDSPNSRGANSLQTHTQGVHSPQADIQGAKPLTQADMQSTQRSPKPKTSPAKKATRSFESFFEENKERLQKLIKNRQNSQE